MAKVFLSAFRLLFVYLIRLLFVNSLPYKQIQL